MLFGSTALEVAIGMIFVYLLLSLLCSAISEYIESVFNFRAKDLRRGIELLLNDHDADGSPAEKGEDYASKLYAHGLIRPLYRSANKLPSYIPARTFALALWNMAGAGAGGDTTDLAKIKAIIDQVPNDELKQALTTLIDEAQGSFDKARKNIEDWYDGSMDRVSGWYKRRVHRVMLVIGFVAAVAINADTINIGKALIRDPALRSSVVAAAEEAVKTPPAAPAPAPTPLTEAEQAEARRKRNEAAKERVMEAKAQLDELGLPLGWVSATPGNEGDLRRTPDTLMGVPLKALGLLLTAFAISQGAPFWFDLLNKFMVIRSTVKPKEKSQEQPSKDKPAPETEVDEEAGDGGGGAGRGKG